MDGFIIFILEMEKGLDRGEGISPDSHLWEVEGLRTSRSETATFRMRGQPEAGPSLRRPLWAQRNVCSGHPSLPCPQAGPGRSCVSSGPLTGAQLLELSASCLRRGGVCGARGLNLRRVSAHSWSISS